MRIRTGLVFVDAHQFVYGKPFEGTTKIITCTGGGEGIFSRSLEPVPEGLEVFGPSTQAVRHPDGHLIEVRDNSWILVAQGGNIIVVEDEKFKSEYLDFLGVETNS